MREHIIKFILEQKHTPTSAFMMYSYFLLATVHRKSLIAANNELIKRRDEILVFGVVSDGVAEEIKKMFSIKATSRTCRLVFQNGI